MAAATVLPDLLSLQSKMKQDPGGYDVELQMQLRHFRACLNVFELQGPVIPGAGVPVLGEDISASKELGDMAMFLAHVTPSYPKLLEEFPGELLKLVSSASLPSPLRRQLTQALILLRNRQKIELVDMLPTFMNLQCLGDRTLKKLVFAHLVHNICHMNRQHRNEVKNRALQNLILPLMQEDNEVRAKRALIMLCDLYRRKIWTDKRMANAICEACFHKSSKIMVAALQFIHGFETRYADEDDDDSGSDEDDKKAPDSVTVSKEAVYKAYHKGTVSSRKRKQAKLERAVRSMKKQQRLSHGEGHISSSPLQHLYDPDAFAGKLFIRLKTSKEHYNVKLMMIKTISRCIGLHELQLFDFYSYIQRYAQPHQQNVTQFLAAAVQACHEKVPPDAVEPLLKQVINSFVHDRAQPEVIVVGLNVVREMCTRMRWIMDKDILQDLSMYRKSREKAVSAAANSIISLFREINPSLLEKKNRGRGADLSIHPIAFGQTVFHSDVPGVELLANDDEEDVDDVANEAVSEDENDDDDVDDDGDDDDDDGEGESDMEDIEDGSDDEEEGRERGEKRRKIEKGDDDGGGVELTELSLKQLKTIAAVKSQSSDIISVTDGILSNEDFVRIRELQAKRTAEVALSKNGLATSSSCVLNERPVNPARLEANIRKKSGKEERVACSRAGREDGVAYGSRTAIKKKKSGGLSNREKAKKKAMPMAARRAVGARLRETRKKKGGLKNQFRGKKAWK